MAPTLEELLLDVAEGEATECGCSPGWVEVKLDADIWEQIQRFKKAQAA